MLGAVTLLYLFALVAYGAKLARRPGVVAEDLAVLPGRAGLAAAVVAAYALALVVAPYAQGGARPVLLAGLAGHVAMLALLLRGMRTGPAERRRVTPVWQLHFAGFIVAALAALALGLRGLALPLFWEALAAAVAVWVLSLRQAARERVPAPLRPLLAIHLAPAVFLGQVALGLGWTGAATAFAVLVLAILAGLAAGLRWLTAAGPTPLWSAFTFPLAAVPGLWLALAGPWHLAGALALVAATLVVPPIAVMVLRGWAAGDLGPRTGAAVA